MVGLRTRAVSLLAVDAVAELGDRRAEVPGLGVERDELGAVLGEQVVLGGRESQGRA